MRSSNVRFSVFALFTLVFVSAVHADDWVISNPGVINSSPNTVKVGLGTAAPASMLHLAGASGVNAITLDTPGTQKFRFQSIPSVLNWGALTLNSNYNGSGWTLDDTAQNGWFFKIDGRNVNGGNSFNGLWLYRIPSGAGNHTNEYPTFGVTNGFSWFRDKVGINLADPNSAPDSNLTVVGTMHVTSNVTIDGNIAAKYQDIAEWVPSTETLTAGMVVVLDRERENQVIASRNAYDTAVAGVVTTQPGIVLGEAAADKAKIATTGRVRVHVDAGKDGIKIGDLLVSSAKPGTAMKSQPMQINGRTFHQPGTVIGKALQALPNGEGDILVLLSLQ